MSTHQAQFRLRLIHFRKCHSKFLSLKATYRGLYDEHSLNNKCDYPILFGEMWYNFAILCQDYVYFSSKMKEKRTSVWHSPST